MISSVIRKYLAILPAIASTALIFISCEGPVGPAGKDAQGFDVVPPTVNITEPWPLSDVWDDFDVSASAIDNVAIREVVFQIDGSPVIGGELLSVLEPPYSKTIDHDALDPGWHYVNARAYDTAGNITTTPVIPINIGDPDALSDAVRVKYHNGYLETAWKLPDSLHAESYWARFTKARTCSLRTAVIRAGGAMSDTTLVGVQVWTGEEMPEDSVTTVELYQGDFTEDIELVEVNFNEVQLSGRDDFFIRIAFINRAPEDTLLIGADNGLPYWNRSGCSAEEGEFTIRDLYFRDDNFMIDCILDYGSDEPPDTTNEN